MVGRSLSGPPQGWEGVRKTRVTGTRRGGVHANN